ncbi:MAG: ComEC/Rec2 family competence protein, partial [Microcoleaceae cyanobacterium]
GIFAGFSVRKIAGNETGESPPLSFFSIRRRIVKPIIEGLGIPEGALVSAIALGKQAIDLPYNIKDTFVLAGLAHAIAASGTQVSLILGVVLALTKRFSKTIKFTLGITSLIILLGLTGLEPSIVRAAFMGVLTLIAIILERQIKPLGALLLAATVLLLINPLWIQDLGFQLSFLATLGLVVTAPPLMKILDFLPTPIASLIAIPIAASIWTLPRLAAVFNCLLPYCIITNILASVLITIISIGGFITAIASLLVPSLGKAISSLLYYPTYGLIELADYFAKLPGNRVNVGTVSLLQEIALYSLFIMVWGIGTFREKQREFAKTQKQKVKPPEKGFRLVPIALIIAIGIIVLPAWKYQTSTFKATILASTKEPILVLNKRGKITLINSGTEDDVRYTVFPWLAQEGVNEIKDAIATHTRLGLSTGWSNLIGQLPIQNFYDIPSSQQAYYNSNQTFLKTLKVRQGVYNPLQESQKMSLDNLTMNVINSDAPLVQFQIDNKKWLLVGDLPINDQNSLALNGDLKDIQVILWSGIPLSQEFISVIQPEIAIVSGNAIDPETERRLRVAKTLIYLTS